MPFVSYQFSVTFLATRLHFFYTEGISKYCGKRICVPSKASVIKAVIKRPKKASALNHVAQKCSNKCIVESFQKKCELQIN